MVHMRRHVSPDEAALWGLLTLVVTIIAIVNLWAGVIAFAVLMVFVFVGDRIFNR